MKILDIALKDLLRSFRSLFFVGMVVTAPLLITGLMYFAFGGMSSGKPDLPAVKVGLVNRDALPADSPLQASLGESIRAMFFDDSVKSWITAADYADEAAARAALDQQEIGVAVIIPAEFTARFLAGEKDQQVLIISDPTLTIGPQVAQNMVTSALDGATGSGIALQTLTERQQASGLQPDPAQIPGWRERYSTWYMDFQRNLFHHPDQAAFVMVAPVTSGDSVDPIQQMMGLVMTGQMIFFAFFTGAYAMMSILQEAEEGTLARLFTTPTDRTQILLGKFLAVFLAVILQGLVLLTAGRLAFGVRWGAPGSVALALTGQVVAAAGLGVLLIAFVKTSKQGGPVLGGGLTGLGMLGGLFTSNISMPAAFALIGNFTPQGWVLKIWKLCLAGQPPAELLLPLAVLIVMGLVMFAIGAAMFKRRYA